MPTISRVAFTLFGQPIYWYGILIASAMLAGALLCALREKRYRLPRDTTINLSLLMIPLALIGARAYYVAFTWSDYAADPLKIFDVRSGGMAIYGGIIGGFAAAILYAARARQPFWRLADLAAPALALGQAIGRWGNFINQEAYGIAVTDPARQFFPYAVYIEADESWHMAAFFYESAWCLLICAFLLIYERAAKRRADGRVFFWYTLLYSAERALVEGIRTDSLMWGGVRASQALSAAVFVLSAVLLAATRTKGNGRRSL